MESNKIKNLNWLLERTINTEAIQSFGIEFDDKIKIPVCSPDGIFLFNKHRRNPYQQEDGTPKYTYDLGGTMSLFAANKIKNCDTVVITESELCAVALWSHNIPAVSSTGGAGGFKEEWIELLKGKKVYIALDNDQAGIKGTLRILKFIPDAYVVQIPTAHGIKDVTNYLQLKRDFSKLMAESKQFLTIEDARQDRDSRQTKFECFDFAKAWEDDYYARMAEPVKRKRSKLNGTKIEQAKSVPITNFIKFNPTKDAPCIFHSEKSPSMHYYKETNTVYCFGCSKNADVIDVYQKLNNCTIVQAVEELLK